MLAAAVAIGAFFLPQEAPLVYFPLNDPSAGVMQLEITCAANVSGTSEVFLDTGDGYRPTDRISWPIAPSTQPYTYNFPLPDAPLCGLRLDPFFTGPGELTITNLRLIERHGPEIRQFTKDDFKPRHQIASIQPIANGWMLVAAKGADDPYTFLEFPAPIVPAGMNGRNLQRCLLSWSYLALMLWILLLAVYLVLGRGRERRPVTEAGDGDREKADLPAPPRPGAAWPSLARGALFLAYLALLFSAVGNRGLIRESLRCARWPAPRVEPGLELQIDLAVDSPTPAQLFWDTGQGFSQTESAWCAYEPDSGLQTLRFPLPRGRPIRGLRFDPLTSAGEIRIRGIRLVDRARCTRLRLSPAGLRAGNQIASIEQGDDQTMIRTQPEATDPSLGFAPADLAEINRVVLESGDPEPPPPVAPDSGARPAGSGKP